MSAENPADEIIVFRACFKRRAGDLSGEGASIYGGRWNKKGQAVVYTSDSRALALLEMRVHYPAIPIEVAVMMVLRLRPGSIIQTIPISALPEGWNTYGEEGIELCQSSGSDWFNYRVADVLMVPSAVLPTQSNYIVRADAGVLTQIEVEPLELDPRLWPNPTGVERRQGPEKILQLLRVLTEPNPGIKG